MLYSAFMQNKPNLPEDIGGNAVRSWRQSCKAGAVWMMVAFMTDVPGAWLIAHHKGWPFFLHIVIAALPLVASALYVYGIVNWIRGMDELHRAITSAAFVFSIVSYLFLFVAWTSLNAVGVFEAAFQWNRLEALGRAPFGNCTFIICMTYVLFGIAYKHIFNRRYQ